MRGNALAFCRLRLKHAEGMSLRFDAGFCNGFVRAMVGWGGDFGVNGGNVCLLWGKMVGNMGGVEKNK